MTYIPLKLLRYLNSESLSFINLIHEKELVNINKSSMRRLICIKNSIKRHKKNIDTIKKHNKGVYNYYYKKLDKCDFYISNEINISV